MARVHAHRRGQSHSTRPVTKRPPSWCTYRPEEVESQIIKLAKEGNPPDKIGMILRDQYGIPLTRSITNKKITQILSQAGLAPKIPEDLAALLKRSSQLARHLEKNRGDHKNVHSLYLLESRIHRLVEYYKRRGKLPADWKYKPIVGSFM
ncbi:30S ribosomal protein S15 [Candidatus Hecatella orcuttiae]|uniref:30S ribosomal protein S15 n=1 Tax=Candidatus Hecatella orcuttiae TaxID=1935119 RepID=UPI002867F3B6|nr:30S ribosomal protein S15 [Candidatus Hecatella orcuttiae]